VRLSEAGRFATDWVRSVSVESLRRRSASLGAKTLPAAALDIEWLDLLDSRLAQRPAIMPFRSTVHDPAAKLSGSFGGYRDDRTLRFEIEDDSAREPSLDLSFEPGGALIGEQRAADMLRSYVARKTPLRWTAWRRGFAPVFGDERAFERAKKNEDVARIRFAPGWGAVLWCRATDGAGKSLQIVQGLGYAGDESISPLHRALAAPPLPSVRVMIDGTLAGASDAEGVVRLTAKTEPAHLVLVADHWHMKELQRFPKGLPSTERYVVWMERD
jgi:hypothetical protein